MNALKKIEQAKYHLDLMKELSPNEDAFLFNLVSFISSAREVTWYLQKEFRNNPRFKDWYSTKQQEMRKDETFKFFLNKRNVVVKEAFPDLKGYTGSVTFYYINGEGNIAVGSCWAHPSTLPTDIVVPGGVVTIAPDQVTAKTSMNTILRRVDYNIEYFFEDKLDKPITALCREYLSSLERLCMEWADNLALAADRKGRVR